MKTTKNDKIVESGCNGCEATARLSKQELRKGFSETEDKP